MRNAPFFALLLLATLPLPVRGAELIQLKEGEREAGTLEWPRPGLRVVEADVGELDPRWVYSVKVDEAAISTGKATLRPQGRPLPVTFAEDVGLIKGGHEKFSVHNGHSFIEGAWDGDILDLKTGKGPHGQEVITEITLGLPIQAAPAQEAILHLRLPQPMSGVILPPDAIWHRLTDQEAGKEPGSWVFAWSGREIRRIKVQPGPETERGVEIPSGVLPGEKFLAGELRELYTRFELQAPPPKGEQYMAPVVQAAHRRIWSKFLWAWGGIGLGFLVWITWYFRKARSHKA